MNQKPDMNAAAAPLVLALPSKGRLQENANAFFARAGTPVVQGRGARDYRGSLAGMPGVEVAFLSASEIVQQLASGAAHLGITGEDLIRESLPEADARDHVELLAPLGFGHADVVVAVPQGWIDVRTMDDLEDVAHAFRARRGTRMRVATKFTNLTRRYFAGHGVTDYRIVESLGATEGAPAAGNAELIVDITTTGATLAANGLKILDDGTMLKSQANLVASLRAVWTPAQRAVARALFARISAQEEAGRLREVRAFVGAASDYSLGEAMSSFSARAPFGPARDGVLTLHCPKANTAHVATWLISHGAQSVTVGQLDYVFCANNALFERLSGRIG